MEHIHGGNLREAAEKYGLKESSLLDFSANINPLGPSPKAVEAIKNNLNAIAHYPDTEAKLLRRTVSQWLGLPEEYIVAGNGAVEIIYLLVKVINPQRALIPAPTFNEYEIAVRINGSKVKDLLLNKEKDFEIDKEDIYRYWGNSDIVFICNPNNPTGRLTGREQIEEITAKAAELGKYVVVDEAFMDFVFDGAKYSVVDLVPKYNNLFVLYSLTKFFAMPGLRLGLGLGHRKVIQKINRVRDPWNVNCFAQLAGIASLEDREYIKATKEYMIKEKDYLFSKIKAVKGFRPYYPQANYIFIDVAETGYTSQEICSVLGERGILVRDCGYYTNLEPLYIRVAVRTREQNNKLIKVLQAIGRKH